MSNLESYLGLNMDYLLILLVNMLIAVILLLSARFIIGAISGVKTGHELAEKDNPAMGISLAGVVFGIGLILTGALIGESASNLAQEAMSVALTGVLGILYIFITRMIFDRFSFAKFKLKKEILDGNIAVSITDALNVVAAAIIIRNVLLSVEGSYIEIVYGTFISFLISQLLLSLVTYYRSVLYTRHTGRSLQEDVQGGNVALSIRFGGFRIAMALAISSALTLAPLDLNHVLISLSYWLGFSAGMMVFVSIVTTVCEKVFLHKISARHEVDNEQNVAIAIIQAALYIVIALAVLSVNI